MKPVFLPSCLFSLHVFWVDSVLSREKQQTFPTKGNEGWVLSCEHTPNRFGETCACSQESAFGPSTFVPRAGSVP